MPEIPATLPPEKKRSILATLLRPKVAIPLLLVVIVLISPLLIRGWFLRGVPDIPEPFDPAPLLSLEIPDAEDAFTDYQQASALFIEPSKHVADLRDGGTTEIPRGINDEGWHLADDEVRQFLHDNEDALLAFRRGSEKEQAQYLLAQDYDIATILDLPQQMREFQRAVMLLGRKLEAEGKYEEAWDWYRASVRASRHCGMNGAAIERLIGVAGFSMTTERLADWAANPGVSGELLLRAIKELQADWALTERSSTIWKIEYLSLVRTIDRGDQGKFDWGDFGESPYGDLPVNSFTLYLMGESKLGRRLLKIFTANQLKYCDLLPFERPDLRAGLYDTGNPAEITAEEFNDAVHRSFIARQFLPTQLIQGSFDRDEIKYRTLLVTLAAQVFYRDNERFPNTLDELVPGYLAEIPLDIYDGKPLKYRFDPTGPVVYSVFENRIDDGGVEWSFDQTLGSGKYGPDDFGNRLRIPQIKPLRAEKIPVELSEDDAMYDDSDSIMPE